MRPRVVDLAQVTAIAQFTGWGRIRSGVPARRFEPLSIDGRGALGRAARRHCIGDPVVRAMTDGAAARCYEHIPPDRGRMRAGRDVLGRGLVMVRRRSGEAHHE